MSAFGTAVGKVVGLGGGPQITAALLLGGLVIGGAAGGFIASGPGGSQGTAGAQLEIYPCPDQGPAIAKVSSGQQMLVTGKTADGAWLRIFFPAPGRTEGWVQAQALKLDSSGGCAAGRGVPAGDRCDRFRGARPDADRDREQHAVAIADAGPDGDAIADAVAVADTNAEGDT